MPYWSCLYQYAVGGTVFFAAILLLLRSKAIRWDRPAERRALGVLLGGFVLYAVIHALSVLAFPPI